MISICFSEQVSNQDFKKPSKNVRTKSWRKWSEIGTSDRINPPIVAAAPQCGLRNHRVIHYARPAASFHLHVLREQEEAAARLPFSPPPSKVHRGEGGRRHSEGQSKEWNRKQANTTEASQLHPYEQQLLPITCITYLIYIQCRYFPATSPTATEKHIKYSLKCLKCFFSKFE